MVQGISSPSESLASDILFAERKVETSIDSRKVAMTERKSEVTNYSKTEVMDIKKADVLVSKAKSYGKQVLAKQKAVKSQFESGAITKKKPISTNLKVPLVRFPVKQHLPESAKSEGKRHDSSKSKLTQLSTKADTMKDFSSKIPPLDDWFCDEENVSFANVKRYV